MSPRRKTPRDAEGLTERQRLLLALVVREYVATAQPVGSRHLVEKYHLNASPATVRNDLNELTRRGFLHQPHPSAGRVPTEQGYRYFVSQLMGRVDLPETVKHTIAHQFHQAGPDMEAWMRLAAAVLARQARAASLVTAPHPEEARFQHLELIATYGRQVLMVLVLAGGEVRQQMLLLQAPVPQERLRQVADALNRRCQGQTLEQLRSLTPPQDALEADIFHLVLREMESAQRAWGEAVYRDGLTEILSLPEFADEGARQALRVLEERPLLERLLHRLAATTEVGGVQVLIGSDSAWEELRHCSMVLARYGVAGLATGMVGVLGPMRMAYTRTIPTVRYVAQVLTNLVSEALTQEG